MFYTPSMLTAWLKSCIVSAKISDIYPECSGGILLLNDWKSTLSPECLYIGDTNTVFDALTRKLIPDESYIFLCAGSSESLNNYALPERVSLIQTNLDLLGLYNKVQYHVHKFLNWVRKLQESVLSNEGFQKILDSANEGMETTLVMLNAGYKVMASCYAPDIQDPLVTQLQQNGYLSFETVKEITGHSITDEHECVEYSSPVSSTHLMMWPIRINNSDTVVGRLLVIMNGSNPLPIYHDLCQILITYLKQYMLSGHIASYIGNMAFATLVADLIQLKLVDPDELKERLKQIPLVVKSYYHLLVVSFPDDIHKQPNNAFAPALIPPNIPWNYVVSQLQQIFPFSNITIYRNEILILVRKTSSGPQLEFDTEAVTRILNYYNGYMAVGNYSKFLLSLPPIYHQTRTALRLGPVMSNDPQQRVFYYEEYAPYQMIELAAISLRNVYGITNYVYLCHPLLIRLYRYDRKHKNNLCHVLFVYLSTDRNAAEAARLLYLHRNTMLYKISRIEEIIGQSLDDSNLRFRLLYSCHVLEYTSRYLQIDILELYKGQQPSLSWLDQKPPVPLTNMDIRKE